MFVTCNGEQDRVAAGKILVQIADEYTGAFCHACSHKRRFTAFFQDLRNGFQDDIDRLPGPFLSRRFSQNRHRRMLFAWFIRVSEPRLSAT
jgi:hypothetical protein